MIVRPAVEADAPAIARLLLLAMEDIVFAFIGVRDEAQAAAFMHHQVSATGNQYSWSNAYVAEHEGTVVGAVCVYDGARLLELREPVLRYLQEQHGRSVTPEPETGPGEWYIDTLGVDPDHRGNGIGSALLQAIMQAHAHEQRRTLGLLVDLDNPAARKLYLRLGFTSVGERPLMGKRLEHLQYRAPRPLAPR